uniref:Uncharacterized protein n=1 Tax=Romanomermis culicivorax TaxID=13658 RepID=A0A915I0H7_ROMCU
MFISSFHAYPPKGTLKTKARIDNIYRRNQWTIKSSFFNCEIRNDNRSSNAKNKIKGTTYS